MRCRVRAPHTDAMVIVIPTHTAGRPAAAAPISAAEFAAACSAFDAPRWATTRRQQLAEQIAQAVAAGKLREGAQLPSVPAAATALGVSINTVLAALALSREEGCVVHLPRRGYIVAPSVRYSHFFTHNG